MSKEINCLTCKGTGKVKGATCSDCNGQGKKRIEFASTESVDYLTTFTDMVMEEIRHITGIGDAWISDESEVSHFMETDAEVTALSEALGIPVDIRDTIVDVAKRLRDA